jgi:hypothetical protein
MCKNIKCGNITFDGCKTSEEIILHCKVKCYKVFSETSVIIEKNKKSFNLTTPIKFKDPIDLNNFLSEDDNINILSGTQPSLTYAEDYIVMVYNDLIHQLLFTKSSDSGLTWDAPIKIVENVQRSPNISYNSGVLGITYITYDEDDRSNRFLRFIKSDNHGVTWSLNKIYLDYGTYRTPSLVGCKNGFAIAYQSDNSNVDNKEAIFFTKSTDQGDTWPVPINVQGDGKINIINYSPSLVCCGDTFAIAYQGQGSSIKPNTLKIEVSNNTGDTWNTFDTNEQIIFSPSLVYCRNKFAIAYQGFDEKLYFIESIGLNAQFLFPVSVNGPGTINGAPSLVCCDDTYSIAFRNGNNVLSLVTRKNNKDWVDPIQIGDSISSSPSLTFGNNKLAIAYSDNTDNMRFVSSTSQSVNWIVIKTG